jgi:hypothetical protein
LLSGNLSGAAEEEVLKEFEELERQEAEAKGEAGDKVPPAKQGVEDAGVVLPDVPTHEPLPELPAVPTDTPQVKEESGKVSQSVVHQSATRSRPACLEQRHLVLCTADSLSYGFLCVYVCICACRTVWHQKGWPRPSGNV